MRPDGRKVRGETWRRGALALAVLLPLAGCLSAVAEGPSLLAGADAPGPDARQLLVTLADLPAGADWVLLEVTPEAESALELDFSSSLPVPTPRAPCLALQVNERGFLLFGTGFGPATVGSTLVGRGPLLSVPTALGGESVLHYGGTFAASPDAPLLVLVALKDARAWEDATVDLRVSSAEPFAWRVREAGTFACLTEFYDFEQGEFTETPAYTTASGLRHGIALERAGFGWLAPHADQGYAFRMTGPSGVVWEEEMPPGRSGRGHALFVDEPGAYALEVPWMRGMEHAGVAAAVFDLPPDVVETFRRATSSVADA